MQVNMSHYFLVGSMKLKGHQISMYGAPMQVNMSHYCQIGRMSYKTLDMHTWCFVKANLSEVLFV